MIDKLLCTTQIRYPVMNSFSQTLTFYKGKYNISSALKKFIKLSEGNLIKYIRYSLKIVCDNIIKMYLSNVLPFRKFFSFFNLTKEDVENSSDLLKMWKLNEVRITFQLS